MDSDESDDEDSESEETDNEDESGSERSEIQIAKSIVFQLIFLIKLCLSF